MNNTVDLNEMWFYIKKAYNDKIALGETTYEESNNILRFVDEQLPKLIIDNIHIYYELIDELKYDNRIISAFIESYFINYNQNHNRDIKYETYIPEEVELNTWYIDQEEEKTRK